MADEQAEWLASLLEASIRASGLSRRQLEEKLRWSAGSLTRILEGEEECEPQQVLAVLDELSARRGSAAQRPPGSSMVDELLARYQRLGGYGAQTPPPVARTPSQAELEQTVKAALHRAFGSRFEENGEEEDGGAPRPEPRRRG